MAGEIEFIKKLVPRLSGIQNNDEYLISRFNLYMRYMEQAEIPRDYLDHKIILDNPLPDSMAVDNPNYMDFIHDVNDFIECEYNLIFNFSDISLPHAEKLGVYIIQNYIKSYIEVDDRPIKRMAYIDAHALMNDLKRSIGNSVENESIGRSYMYKYETLSSGIENYEFIIWDNIMGLDTPYEKEELNNILRTRHQRGLCNLLFTHGNREDIVAHLGKAHERLLGCDFLEV